MLAIAPERVRLDRVASGTVDLPGGRTGLHEPIVIVPRRIDNDSGVDGDPSAATAAKGRQIFDASVAEIVAHLQAVTAEWGVRPTALEAATLPAPATPARATPETGARLRDLYGREWLETADRCDVAVLPMGAASKEHGYHLPNQTDYLTAEALGAAAVRQLPILLLPTFGYGYYPAFVDWPGSMSLSPAVYRRVVADIIGCLARAGIRKIFLLDTGLSTRPVLEIAVHDALREHGITVALATTELGREAAHRLFDGEGTHANEDETALMLAIAPEQVDLARAVPDLRPSTVLDRRDPFAPPAFIQGGKMRSASGVFGDPTKATPESGRAYLDAKIHDLVTFLREYITRDV
jgi:creatinine amidohydrolase